MSKNTTDKIYMVEDRASLTRCYSEFLSNENVEITILSSGDEALKYFQLHSEPCLILLDLQVKDVDGLKILDEIHKVSPGSAVVVITSNGSFETSRKVMSMGAVDYLEKPFTRDRLCVTMRNARKQLELEKIANPFGEHFAGFIGSSLVMQNVYRIIESAATSSKASVFITGESGTGKEVCSLAIHDLSDRRDNECVILNCAAIPKDLIESEIFGHVKGAFTGAVTSREGAATRAHNGTLFLDEIGEMDLELQSKLLRVVQTGRFSKVGSSVVETVNVRFICATNRNPLEEIENRRFREDLYYRLNVIPIDLPPLRKRGEDIIEIAEHYLHEFCEEEKKTFDSFSAEVKDLFLSYSWPGNVRQLLNVVRNIAVLNNGTIVESSMLPAPFNGSSPMDFAQHSEKPSHSSAVAKAPAPGANEDRPGLSADKDDRFNAEASEVETIKPLWKVEMEIIDKAIRHCDGNITKAAKLLEINPSTIHRKKQSWISNGFMMDR